MGNKGFYSAQEFDFSSWPQDVVLSCVEVGRACIAKNHRHRSVLLQLWRGLGTYALFNQCRYFFGCCSLTSQDPAEAAITHEYIQQKGYAHPELKVAPLKKFDCHEYKLPKDGWEGVRLPTLFRTYLRYGGAICGRPALDIEFKTIDFLAIVDLFKMDPEKILRQFEVDIRNTQ